MVDKKTLYGLYGAIAVVFTLLVAFHRFGGSSSPVAKGSQQELHWIRGRELLADPDKFIKKYGKNMIHQSWKNEQVPTNNVMHSLAVTWEKHHPDAAHVLWTDEDNLNLLKQFYPQFLDTYNSMVLPVERADFARLVYVHKFGGVYADLDYEANANFWESVEKDVGTEDDVYIANSPALLNEVLQNSMFASPKPGHPYWMACMESIREILHFVNDLEGCRKHGWSGCETMEFFHSFWTRKAAHMVMVIQLTGPCVLDKTLVKNRHKNWKIRGLPVEKYFLRGKEQRFVHHQSSVWADIPGALRPVFLGIGGAACVAILLAVWLTRWLALNGYCGKRR